VLREEIGVLPMPTRGLPRQKLGSPFDAGYAGGWFHPTTAYSLPIALRVALAVAAVPPGESLSDALAPLAREQRRQFRFGAFLNRLLFGAFAPEDRWNVLARFYRLPEETIHRFYALETTRRDRLRILCGRPPRGMSFTPTALRSALA
jgi:lycopene beta-cyclase